MRNLESKVLSLIRLLLPFYYRYVDDIIITFTLINLDFDIFNSQHPRIQTIEIGDDRLNFLDVTLIINNKSEFD